MHISHYLVYSMCFLLQISTNVRRTMLVVIRNALTSTLRTRAAVMKQATAFSQLKVTKTQLGRESGLAISYSLIIRASVSSTLHW